MLLKSDRTVAAHRQNKEKNKKAETSKAVYDVLDKVNVQSQFPLRTSSQVSRLGKSPSE